ncbi:MAG: hypothetical protein ACE5E6_10520 [Phycisphaerae bacterium]
MIAEPYGFRSRGRTGIANVAWPGVWWLRWTRAVGRDEVAVGFVGALRLRRRPVQGGFGRRVGFHMVGGDCV